MNKYISVILINILTICAAISQEVVSSTFLISYDTDYFQEELAVPFSVNDVDLYRILYTTKSISGAVDTASGLLVIPKQEGVNFPLVSYSHGTASGRFDVPGYLSFEHNLPAIYGSMGVVCFAPDYLGLGNSSGIHPYVHADSEAWANYDMMLALQDFLPNELNVKINDQLYITGYSQGGHAAMAFHRLLETEKDIEVNASFPMSGPYSISTAMKELLLSDEEYGLPTYLAGTAISYQSVYGNIYPNGDITQFFKDPYADIVLKMINEEADLITINQELVDSLISNEGGVFPKKMIFDNIVDDVLSNEDHPINIALRDNDVFDWAPIADTRLLYCSGDEQVNFQNSLIAEAKMKENGATMVTAIELDPNFNHTECVTPAATTFVLYLLLNATTTSQSELNINSPTIYPNPTSGDFNINLNRLSKAIIKIYNAQGQLITSSQIEDEINQISFNRNPGIYFIKLTDTNGQSIANDRLIVR